MQESMQIDWLVIFIAAVLNMLIAPLFEPLFEASHCGKTGIEDE